MGIAEFIIGPAEGRPRWFQPSGAPQENCDPMNAYLLPAAGYSISPTASAPQKLQEIRTVSAPVKPGTGTARHRAVISPRILKASILGVTAAAIVVAVLSVENPRLLFANATAFLAALSAPQDGAREEMPIVQSSAGTPPNTTAQALPPMASEAPTDKEMAAPFKTADQSQPEIGQAPAEDLLGQFQAWAAGQDARTEVQPAQPAPPVQPVPVQPVQEAK